MSLVLIVTIEAEGRPINADYQASVRRGFARFVEQGWGPQVTFTLEFALLAGETDNGRPPAQLVVLPHIQVE